MRHLLGGLLNPESNKANRPEVINIIVFWKALRRQRMWGNVLQRAELRCCVLLLSCENVKSVAAGFFTCLNFKGKTTTLFTPGIKTQSVPGRIIRIRRNAC